MKIERDASSSAAGGKKRGRWTLDRWARVPRLGIDSDTVIARRLGVSRDTVGAARRALGIERYRDAGAWDGCDWSQTDRQIGEIYGVSPRTVYQVRHRLGKPPPAADRRFTRRWDGVPLGEIPDSVLAHLLGVTRNTVQSARGRSVVGGATYMNVMVPMTREMHRALRGRHDARVPISVAAWIELARALKVHSGHVR